MQSGLKEIEDSDRDATCNAPFHFALFRHSDNAVKRHGNGLGYHTNLNKSPYFCVYALFMAGKFTKTIYLYAAYLPKKV